MHNVTQQFFAQNHWSGFFDFSLIQLANPVTLSQSVNLACLPNPHEDEALQDVPITVTGWGHHSKGRFEPSNVLRSAVLSIVEAKHCEAAWAKWYMLFNPTIQVCANQGPIKKRSACFGDSGGNKSFIQF